MLPPGYQSTLHMDVHIRFGGEVEISVILKIYHETEGFVLALKPHPDTLLWLSTVHKLKHDLMLGSQDKQTSSTSSVLTTTATRAKTLTNGLLQKASTVRPWKKSKTLSASSAKSPSLASATKWAGQSSNTRLQQALWGRRLTSIWKKRTGSLTLTERGTRTYPHSGEPSET